MKVSVWFCSSAALRDSCLDGGLLSYADKDPGVVASHSKKEEVLVLGQWQAQESGHGRGGAVFRPPRSNGTEVGAGGPGAWVSPEELPDCQSSDPG